MTAKIYDVLIIGGGPAGLATATVLVRQLQTALVLDSGVYRNARATHLHGVPGFDHADAAVFRTKAKGDLMRRYDTVEFRRATIVEVQKRDSDALFQAVDRAGNAYRGRKVVLATGVRDISPDIEGYHACWGYGILFCQGFEERGGKSAGFFAFDTMKSAPTVTQVGLMVLNLVTNLTIYTNGDEAVTSDVETNAKFSAAQKEKVTVEKRRIKSVRNVSTEASDILVTLEDGTEIQESFIAYHPMLELNGPFASQLGLEIGPQGEIQTSPPFYETSVKGVYAAGDAASQRRMVVNAIHQGAAAGAGLVAQLLAEKAAQPE